MGRLDGKVALIFGAGPNNGGTIAHFMAKEGAKIAVCDIAAPAMEDTVKFLQGKGYDAFGMVGDASEEDQVASMVKQAVDHYGYIDTMVNLAGRQIRHPITEMTLDDWNVNLKTFLTAGMLTTKHTALAMIDKEKQGSMIHLISTAGHYGEAGNSAYSAVKAGLLNFSRAAAMDLAHLQIRVNTVTPYAMEHNLFRGQMAAGGPEPERTRYSITRDDVLKVIPLGRFPRATDLAHACVFLASDEAEFLTGIDIPCDGGTRFKYPSWRPGDFTGVTTADYRKVNKPMRYGEPVE